MDQTVKETHGPIIADHPLTHVQSRITAFIPSSDSESQESRMILDFDTRLSILKSLITGPVNSCVKFMLLTQRLANSAY